MTKFNIGDVIGKQGYWDIKILDVGEKYYTVVNDEVNCGVNSRLIKEIDEEYAIKKVSSIYTTREIKRHFKFKDNGGDLCTITDIIDDVVFVYYRGQESGNLKGDQYNLSTIIDQLNLGKYREVI